MTANTTDTTVPTLLMLGVVGIGGYALYRMLTGSNKTPPLDPIYSNADGTHTLDPVYTDPSHPLDPVYTNPPSPPLDPVYTATTSTAPGSGGVDWPSLGLSLAADPSTSTFHLTTGRFYKMRFESVADPTLALMAAGFTGVAATQTPDASWNQGAIANPSATTWFVAGGWVGAPQDMPKPAGLVAAWIAQPPAGWSVIPNSDV